METCISLLFIPDVTLPTDVVKSESLCILIRTVCSVHGLSRERMFLSNGLAQARKGSILELSSHLLLVM